MRHWKREVVNSEAKKLKFHIFSKKYYCGIESRESRLVLGLAKAFHNKLSCQMFVTRDYINVHVNGSRQLQKHAERLKAKRCWEQTPKLTRASRLVLRLNAKAFHNKLSTQILSQETIHVRVKWLQRYKSPYLTGRGEWYGWQISNGSYRFVCKQK